MYSRIPIITGLTISLLLLFSGTVYGADLSFPGVDITIGHATGGKREIANALKIVLGLTILSLAPAILVSMTAFTRIVIVLSMIRHGLGMQGTPPNNIIISLALFLTLFTMMPVISKMNTSAYQPFMANKLDMDHALQLGAKPLRDFMIRQTRESDLALMVDISKGKQPSSVEDISLAQLIPAFMLSELKSAFQIGFVVLLPFLLIDIIVATVLMSMGMVMVPPVMIALPLKVLMFVLIDGWNLVVRSLISSFI